MKAAKSVRRDIKVLLILYISWSTVGADVIELIDSLTSDDQRVAFIEQGAPVVTEITEQFFKAKLFQFVPKYVPLMTYLGNKESIYVTLQDPTKINDNSFHLYGPRHPDAENYKMEMRSSTIVINKCKKPEDCKNLTKCEQQSIRLQKNVTLSKSNVFISWEKSSEILIILVQYENKQTKCMDVNPFHFEKLVMYSKEQQQVSTFRQKFMQIPFKNPDTMFESQKFDLNTNFSVYVQILPRSCEIVVSLNCSNFTNTIYLGGSDTSNMMCENTAESPVWVDIILPRQRMDKRLTECSLKIAPMDRSVRKRECDFFNFGKSLANIELPNLYDVLTKTYELHGIPIIVRCPICEIDFSIVCENGSHHAQHQLQHHTIPGKNALCDDVMKWNDKTDIQASASYNCTLIIMAVNQECLNYKFWKVIECESPKCRTVNENTTKLDPITNTSTTHTLSQHNQNTSRNVCPDCDCPDSNGECTTFKVLLGIMIAIVAGLLVIVGVLIYILKKYILKKLPSNSNPGNIVAGTQVTPVSKKTERENFEMQRIETSQPKEKELEPSEPREKRPEPSEPREKGAESSEPEGIKDTTKLLIQKD